MKTLLCILLISFSTQFSHAQTEKGKEFYSKEFKWRIKIPEGFKNVPAEEWERLQQKGTKAIEDTYDAKIENQAKPLIVLSSSQFDYFEANVQPFDSATDGNYEETVKEVNNILYGTFEAQLPNAKMDSASSLETIDGKVFHKFRVTIVMSQTMSLELLAYSRLFGNKEFSVNIMAIDKEKRKALLDAWRNSKFE